MELEKPNPEIAFKPEVDKRPRVPEPLPVKLIAVNDMRIESAAGLERKLDAFYVTLLGMERRDTTGGIVYRTDNFDLIVEVMEPPVMREDFRPVRAEIKSLADAKRRLREMEAEFVRRKGLVPGDEALVLQDPAGNWIELTESRLIA